MYDMLKLCLSDASEVMNTPAVFTASVAASLIHELDFQKILLDSQELKYIDLSLMKTEEERMCFYGNLANLMTLHVHLSLIYQQTIDIRMV